jgi:hypothetical protein
LSCGQNINSRLLVLFYERSQHIELLSFTLFFLTNVKSIRYEVNDYFIILNETYNVL